ncbi:hypothetical protein L6452_05652 [Arctium lappa]|uniref:Uncharacterized protein n=1 Tax=Arctium lappa TaxID=4217 RepID=A0ACB9EGP1_ARCLA|nr:hypothetical protein L6452_05652 [Arctium lappa]
MGRLVVEFVGGIWNGINKNSIDGTSIDGTDNEGIGIVGTANVGIGMVAIGIDRIGSFGIDIYGTRIAVTSVDGCCMVMVFGGGVGKALQASLSLYHKVDALHRASEDYQKRVATTKQHIIR